MTKLNMMLYNNNMGVIIKRLTRFSSKDKHNNNYIGSRINIMHIDVSLLSLKLIQYVCLIR